MRATTRGVAILAIGALAILGPATALCSLSCAAKAEQAAAITQSDACPGHPQHSTPHGGTKDCGGHTGTSVVATAPVQIIASGNATLTATVMPLAEQRHKLFADRFSFRTELPGAKDIHPRSAPPALRI